MGREVRRRHALRDRVTEAFVRARKTGIDPYSDGLRKMGDAASGANKTLLDTVEAVADAQNFQYERLREFNITSSTKGQAVTFDYMTKAGKEASKTVKKTKLDIQHALLGIFDEMSGGAMKLRSQTLPGILSNLKDTFTKFQFDVASGGFYDKVKAKLQEILGWLNAAAKDGRLQQWAQRISTLLSDIIERAWTFAKQTDWGRVVADLKAVATATISVARALNFVVELVGKAVAAYDKLHQMSVQGSFGPLVQWREQLRDRLPSLLFGGSKPQAAPTPPPRPTMPALGSPLRGAWSRALQHGPAAPAVRQPSPIVSPVKSGGKIAVEIHLKGPAAAQASVRRVSTEGDGFSASVFRGRAMGNPA